MFVIRYYLPALKKQGIALVCSQSCPTTAPYSSCRVTLLNGSNTISREGYELVAPPTGSKLGCECGSQCGNNMCMLSEHTWYVWIIAASSTQLLLLAHSHHSPGTVQCPDGFMCCLESSICVWLLCPYYWSQLFVYEILHLIVVGVRDSRWVLKPVKLS